MNYQEDQEYGSNPNNRKKIIAILVILVIVAVACIVLFNRKTPDAPTSQEEALDFTWIRSVEDFQLLKDSGEKFKLANDIDFSGVTTWEPIVFSGELDGNGHRLLNITFPCMFSENNGTIKNLTVSNLHLYYLDSQEHPHIGMVTHNKGTISHCSVTQSTLKSAYSFGFFAVYNSGIVEDCSVTESGISEGYIEGGGIVFQNDTEGRILRCYTNMTFQLFGRLEFGGIVKNNYGTVSACYSGSSIDAEIANHGNSIRVEATVVVGGIASYNDARIEECYSVLQMNVLSVARNESPLSGVHGSYAISNLQAGGIAGSNLGEIVNCFADVNLLTKVDGSDKNNSKKELILNNYTGYLHGYSVSEYESGVLQNSYYSQSSTVSALKQDKAVAHNEDGIQASAADLRSQSFCTGTLGWNADNWVFSSSGYPTLK